MKKTYIRLIIPVFQCYQCPLTCLIDFNLPWQSSCNAVIGYILTHNTRDSHHIYSTLVAYQLNAKMITFCFFLSQFLLHFGPLTFILFFETIVLGLQFRMCLVSFCKTVPKLFYFILLLLKFPVFFNYFFL